MRFASFVCSSAKPCLKLILHLKTEVEIIFYLHNYFLGRETTVSFNFEIKFIWFGVKIEGFIVSWWFFFLSIIT